VQAHDATPHNGNSQKSARSSILCIMYLRGQLLRISTYHVRAQEAPRCCRAGVSRNTSQRSADTAPAPVVCCVCVAARCSVLQCVAVCYSVLQCVAVCCSVLQCVAVCCSVLQRGAVCYSVLQCVTVCCHVLQCVAVYCSVVWCVAVCCSVLQCVAVCCSVLQGTPRYCRTEVSRDTAPCSAHTAPAPVVCCVYFAVCCCSSLRCVAVCCGVMQC